MVDTCVSCGAEIPEGRQICWACEHGYTPKTEADGLHETKSESPGQEPNRGAEK